MMFQRLQQARFEIGGEDQLAGIRGRHSQEPADNEGKKRLESDWERVLADLHIRTGTLLKADTVSLLLGAGASKECGGPLISTVPVAVERPLLDDGIAGNEIKPWLKCFYLAVRRAAADGVRAPSDDKEVLERAHAVSNGSAEPFPVNFEFLLTLLHHWRSALPREGGRLQLDGSPAIDVQSDTIEELLSRATAALAQLCRLPTSSADASGFLAYKSLLRKVLTRPLNLKRANVFTLNYDTLVEQAADAEGIVLIDGFVGTVRRAFRPESYDHDLYFPAETTEGRVHRLDRVLHLYKLHGSITWTAETPGWDNPYGIRAHGDQLPTHDPVLIYPTPAKWGEALGMPYAELLRRFATAVVRPQSVLFVVGYGFGDEHICAIVRQALAVPSFTLVIVDPNPQSEFAKRLREQNDRRVWIYSGDTFGRFTGFVQDVLADLREEGIRRKVMDTHRALGNGEIKKPSGEGSGDG